MSSKWDYRVGVKMKRQHVKLSEWPDPGMVRCPVCDEEFKPHINYSKLGWTKTCGKRSCISKLVRGKMERNESGRMSYSEMIAMRQRYGGLKSARENWPKKEGR